MDDYYPVDYDNVVIRHAGHHHNETRLVHIYVETLVVTTLMNSVTFVGGFLCNVMVIQTILRTNTLKTSSINRAVMNLCFADLITVLVDTPVSTIILYGNHLHIMVITLLQKCC